MSNKSSSKASKESLPSLIERLLLLSSHLIVTNGDYTLVIEEYAQALTELEPQLGEATKSTDLTSKLKKLETQHAAVMSRVEKDKDKLKTAISSLKKKGKVVITYTDQLPKRISLSTTKKV